jgi:hypothetical protein
MLARSSSLGLIIAAAVSLPHDRSPVYRIQSSGAVSLSAAGTEAHYGLSSEKVDGKRMLTITLGAMTGQSALMLFTDGSELPRSGRYPVYFSWEGNSETQGRWFHACFIAGTAEHPQGAFHGQSGWVTITSNKAGLISGEFELQAQGFVAANMKNENQWVMLQGSFTAAGDSTTTSLASR